MIGESPMRRDSTAIDANHLCSRPDELLVVVAEPAGLLDTARRLVHGIEEQHDFAAAQRVERQGLPVRRRQDEVGRFIADGNFLLARNHLRASKVELIGEHTHSRAATPVS